MKRKGIILYATEQGLGRQARSFVENGLVQEVFIYKHSRYVNHEEWYPNHTKDFDEFLSKIDELWMIETPFDWKYFLKAREKGIRTVLFLMYECSRLPYIPDVLVGGSIMEKIHFGEDVKVVNVPAPKEIKWRLREKAQVFIHNAGHGGLGGRNGTKELIEAMKYVKSPIKLIIRSQIPITCNDPRVEVRIGDFPYETMFDEGDVFIYPDKFGGSCLPIQEAFSAGMAVMASNRLPLNTWLPKEILIPIKGYKKERITEKEFDSAIVDPRDIANSIEMCYNTDITRYSLAGKKWAEDNSWSVLKPIYEAL